jgi:hypothetical protein
MKIKWMLGAACVGAAALVLSATRHAASDTFGFKGKYEVTKLELGYVPGTRSLKARLRLTSTPGDIEYQTADAETIDRLIRLADMKSRGSHLAVDLEGSEVKAFYVVVGGTFFGKDE